MLGSAKLVAQTGETRNKYKIFVGKLKRWPLENLISDEKISNRGLRKMYCRNTQLIDPAQDRRFVSVPLSTEYFLKYGFKAIRISNCI
jgi:hypothetical protein